MAEKMATAAAESGFVDNWQGEKTLAECNLNMLLTEDQCDVRFRVGQHEEVVRCHRYILMSRSCVFHAMLCGQLAEKDDIKITDVSKILFIEFLKFLYTDICSLSPDNVTGLLYLSKKYAVGRLERLCLTTLETELCAENACVIMEQAHFFDEEKLQEQALYVIIEDGTTSLQTPGFHDLCHGCLDKILGSEDLDVNTPPGIVFDAALSWAEKACSREGRNITVQNQREALGDSIFLIGFTNFNAEDFVRKVIPSKVLTDGECLLIMSRIACPEIDVGMFRIAKFCKVALYDSSVTPSEEDIKLFVVRIVYDKISIESSKDIFIHGITLTPSKATYEVYVKCDAIEMLSTCSTTLRSSRFDFPNRIHLKADRTFFIKVRHKRGECPVQLWTKRKNSFKIKNFTLKISQEEISGGITRGLIKNLILNDK